MADQSYRVEFTASFLERLDAIEAFLAEADAAFAFDNLLAELRGTVLPNLARFPRIGRRYLDNAPQRPIDRGESTFVDRIKRPTARCRCRNVSRGCGLG